MGPQLQAVINLLGKILCRMGLHDLEEVPADFRDHGPAKQTAKCRRTNCTFSTPEAFRNLD